MANFVIYNYQFARIIEPDEQYQIPRLESGGCGGVFCEAAGDSG